MYHPLTRLVAGQRRSSGLRRLAVHVQERIRFDICWFDFGIQEEQLWLASGTDDAFHHLLELPTWLTCRVTCKPHQQSSRVCLYRSLSCSAKDNPETAPRKESTFNVNTLHYGVADHSSRRVGATFIPQDSWCLTRCCTWPDALGVKLFSTSHVQHMHTNEFASSKNRRILSIDYKHRTTGRA